MIQRTFCYPTLDIRTAYAQITKILADKKVTKLVLIAHSQGVIEAGMALDWLYATMSTEEIQKLEIYTFGNAANHWNCPMRHGGPAIKHIEHYCNEWDWVSRFGILHFRPLSLKAVKAHQARAANDTDSSHVTTAAPPVDERRKTVIDRSSTADFEGMLAAPHRFAGRLFIRNASGHQFNQHYLDNFFPMSWRKGNLDRVTDASSDFMNLNVDEQLLAADDTVRPRLSDATDAGRRIKSFSRLWKYTNGGEPRDGEDEQELIEQLASPITNTSACIDVANGHPVSSTLRRHRTTHYKPADTPE